MSHLESLDLATVYLVVSSLTFVVYGIDKAAAARGARRVPETVLHLLGLACGWPGALVARRVFRHKTRKASFLAAFWVVAGMNCAAALWLISAAS